MITKKKRVMKGLKYKEKYLNKINKQSKKDNLELEMDRINFNIKFFVNYGVPAFDNYKFLYED